MRGDRSIVMKQLDHWSLHLWFENGAASACGRTGDVQRRMEDGKQCNNKRFPFPFLLRQSSCTSTFAARMMQQHALAACDDEKVDAMPLGLRQPTVLGWRHKTGAIAFHSPYIDFSRQRECFCHG